MVGTAPLSLPNPFVLPMDNGHRIGIRTSAEAKDRLSASMRIDPRGTIDDWLTDCCKCAIEREFRFSGSLSPRAMVPQYDEPILRVPSKTTEFARQIIDVTRSLFPPGILAIEHQTDPEEPANEYVVVDVQAEGTLAELSDRENQWHEEVRRIVAVDSSWLRLCIYPR